MRSFARLALVALALAAVPARAADESLYQLPLALESHEARPFQLSELKGRIVLLSMFYASCAYACPVLVEDVERIERALPEDVRKDLRVVVVSFDPRDTPKKLVETGKQHGVDFTRWIFARTPDLDARTLAAVLGVKYVKMDNGDYAHNSVVAVLDRSGVMRAKAEGSGDAMMAIVPKVVEAAK